MYRTQDAVEHKSIVQTTRFVVLAKYATAMRAAGVSDTTLWRILVVVRWSHKARCCHPPVEREGNVVDKQLTILTFRTAASVDTWGPRDVVITTTSGEIPVRNSVNYAGIISSKLRRPTEIITSSLMGTASTLNSKTLEQFSINFHKIETRVSNGW